MPLSHEVVDDFLVIQVGGEWNFADMKTTLHSAAKALGGRRLRGVLLDERKSRFTGFHDDFTDMARFHKSLSSRLGRKMAVVVSDELRYGLTRMSSAIHSFYGIDVEPFRDKGKAWTWLSGRNGAPHRKNSDKRLLSRL
jgi:hypothetical protein